MTGWDELRVRCGEPTEMVRRDALRVGDRALSSHYGLRTVAEVEQYGDAAQTTHIVWEGGTRERPMSERYDSAGMIPRAVRLYVSAEVVKAALEQIEAVAADREQLQSVRLSIIRRRVASLHRQIEQQAVAR